MLQEPMMEKLLAMRLHGHGGCFEDTGARSGRSGTEFPGAAGAAGRSPVELASEPGASPTLGTPPNCAAMRVSKRSTTARRAGWTRV